MRLIENDPFDEDTQQHKVDDAIVGRFALAIVCVLLALYAIGVNV